MSQCSFLSHFNPKFGRGGFCLVFAGVVACEVQNVSNYSCTRVRAVVFHPTCTFQKKKRLKYFFEPLFSSALLFACTLPLEQTQLVVQMNSPASTNSESTACQSPAHLYSIFADQNSGFDDEFEFFADSPNVIRLCQHENCSAKPLFGFPQSKPCVCSAHKLNGMVSVQLKRSAKPKIYLKQDWKAIAMAVPSDEVWGKIANEMRSADGLHMIKGRAYKTRTGNVQAMKCTGFRRYGCTYELKVVEDSANETWSVYEGEEPHCHDAFSESTAGIPQHYKTTIEKEVASGKYPRDIYEEILLHSPKTIVQMKQVQGAVHRLRKKLLCEFPDDSIGYLQQFLKSNTLSNASEEHDVGVLPGWHVSDAGSCLEKSNKAANLHFTLTTKALLRQAVSQNEGQLCSFVDIDGTYNLVSNGYPCLILGTVDAKHCFRLLGFTVSMHELS
jgi:hypothetical protein